MKARWLRPAGLFYFGFRLVLKYVRTLATTITAMAAIKMAQGGSNKYESLHASPGGQNDKAWAELTAANTANAE
ncbi:MAG: hypothetical protein EOR94_21350 [Mesorhizobium sp.]|nr:MAG: hypothetical protein EOR94_21350 [Mesorhizobium sp.]